VQRSLSGCEASEVGIRSATKEGIRTQTQIGDGQAIEPLSVGDVEDFPTKLQCMSFPRHLERLVKSHVERDVAGHAQNVSIADFPRSRRSPALIRCDRIA